MNQQVDTWSNLPKSRKSPCSWCQLKWESQVVKYVCFVWKKIQPWKKRNTPAMLSVDVPLFGL